MRRLLREALLVAGVAAGVLVLRAGSAVAPGADSSAWAVDLVGRGGAGAAGAWATPFVRMLGLERGLAVAGGMAFACAAAVVWTWVRPREGSTRPVAAMVATLIGSATPLVLGGALRGTAEALIAPVAVLALWAWERGPAWMAVFATVLVGWVDSAAGLACALAGACVGGRGAWAWAAFAALLASAAGGGLPVSAAASTADLGKAVEGVLVLLLALAALAGVGRAMERGVTVRWTLGVLAAGLVACGPVLPTRGGPMALPAALLAILAPPDAPLGGAVLVATLCTARLVATLSPTSLALAGLLATVNAGRLLVEEWPRVELRRSASDAVLAARTGGVLHLPVAVAGVPGSAPAAANGRWAWAALASGRALPPELATGREVPARSLLLAEPAVVVSAALVSGDGTILVPGGRAGAALGALGVTDLVVHRDAYTPEVLARLDLALHALHGPPQRDLAGNVDLYRLAEAPPSTAPVLPAEVVRTRAGEGRPAGLRTLAEVLGGPVPGRRPHVKDAAAAGGN